MSTHKQTKKHLKAMHQKRKLFQPNEPLMAVFMWGINHSISTLRQISVPVMLMPDDFKAFSKARVDNHLFNKRNMPSHFKFKEYCPNVFRNLREKFNIDEESYMRSLCKYAPVDDDSSGRSGPKFMFSWDKTFVIISLSKEAVAEMHRILEKYHKHIVEANSGTLLPQYLGVYRLTVSDVEHYFVVTRNVFSPRLTIHKKYDLKGSKVDRKASIKEKAKDLPTFKDNDFVSEGMVIEIGIKSKEKLINILRSDVDFLSRMNLMDYSLLVGIHDQDRAEQELSDSSEGEGNGRTEDEESDGSSDAPEVARVRFDTIPICQDSAINNAPKFFGELDPHLEVFAYKCHEDSGRKEIYFLGLIDILTHYGVRKKTAQAAKTVKHGTGAEITTVQPKQYASRFVDFISEKIK